ncbi:MAG: hypothetical protein RBS39_12820 [Phycisphaerales bacterium]|jgi:hypothetical protein|nr:hypothetical protein [Phycisphaerales bacterium]
MGIRGLALQAIFICFAALAGCAGPRHDGMIPLEIIAEPNGASYELVLVASDEPPPGEIAVRTRMPDGTMVNGLYVEPYTGDPTTVPSKVPWYVERVDGDWVAVSRPIHLYPPRLDTFSGSRFHMAIPVFPHPVADPNRATRGRVDYITGEGIKR